MSTDVVDKLRELAALQSANSDTLNQAIEEIEDLRFRLTGFPRDREIRGQFRGTDSERAALTADDKMLLRKELRRLNPPLVTHAHNCHFYIDWAWHGCGFGQLEISLSEDGTTIECENECMRRSDVRQILHSFANYLADRYIAADNDEGGDSPLIDFAAEVASARNDNRD